MDHPSLSKRAGEFIREADNRLIFSIVSVWELILKARAGRLAFVGDTLDFVEVRIQRYNLSILELTLEHLAKVSHLPAHHRDPFDQLLVAQAQVENLPIITSDAQIARYDVEVIW